MTATNMLSLTGTPGPINMIINMIIVPPGVPTPIIVPTINLSMGTLATPACYTTLMMGAPALNMSSIYTLSPLGCLIGPGPVGGVISGTLMGFQQPLSGSVTALINGALAQSMLSTVLTGNANNTIANILFPGCVTVIL